jgi:hypothetical protein
MKGIKYSAMPMENTTMALTTRLKMTSRIPAYVPDTNDN